MDYKQKYEEALERAKRYQGIVVLPAESMIETIFPELRKSDDEKIREEILEYFQQFENEELRGVNISDWIAWLERQGHKSAWKPSDEQMEALDSVIDEYDGYPEFDSLASLKKDLKKL